MRYEVTKDILGATCAVREDKAKVCYVKVLAFVQLGDTSLVSPELHCLDEDESDLNEYMLDPTDPVLCLPDQDDPDYFPCFPKKVVYCIHHRFFCSVTSRSGDRPRDEGATVGVYTLFSLVLRNSRASRGRKFGFFVFVVFCGHKFATPVGTERSQSPKLPQSGYGRVRKVVWSSGVEVQKKSLALVRKRFALRDFSAPLHRSSKPPLALSPNHFGAIWAISLLSIPTGVATGISCSRLV